MNTDIRGELPMTEAARECRTASEGGDVTPAGRPLDRRDRSARERRSKIGEREIGEREIGEREIGEREIGEREIGEREIGEREIEEREGIEDVIGRERDDLSSASRGSAAR